MPNRSVLPPPSDIPPGLPSSAGDRLLADLADLRGRLVAHPLYGRIDSPDRLRQFMEMHVWAVWDFQSLLKAMQQTLTCTSVPWLPTPDPEARRLVNQIVLDEESDELPDGGSASHFELYLDAMERAAADTGPMRRFIDLLRSGVPLDEALREAMAPAGSAAFVRTSFAVIESGSAHRLAAAFTFGREDVIPDMFRRLVVHLAAADPTSWGPFRFYLERHIEHDDEAHAPICRRIVARLCGGDVRRWEEATETAKTCLRARIALWDAIAKALA
jgi:hypothetical protein